MRLQTFTPLTLLLFTLSLTLPPAASAGLVEYVNAPDPTFAYEVENVAEFDNAQVYTVELTSQTWRGIAWEHWLTVIRPERVTHPEGALLFINGGSLDSPPPGSDRMEITVMRRIANATGSITAVLNQVPNQPLFGGLKEDALIAYTYERHLEDGEEDWPLLFPMVKSAASAMTAVQELMESEHGQEISGFMTAGGSKRGWTTWLSAAADDRVKRIAPMIIDMLNTAAQMRHQQKTYGGYTRSIADYTRRNIQDRMLAGEGEYLLSQVDPYAWRDTITEPKLVLLGTNDPFWTVDAANFYYDDIKGEKHLYYMANTEHDVSMQGVATTTEFYNAMLTGAEFPSIDWKRNENGALVVTWTKDGGSANLWQAHSPNRDFRDVAWQRSALEGDGRVSAAVEAPDAGWTAYYVEVSWPGMSGMPFGLTTTMTVIPEDYPEPGIRTYDTQTE
ncbi:MAG: PhoPQ-activated pathogenicity-related family protein [Candidatus Hydrogenedentota bacterium]